MRVFGLKIHKVVIDAGHRRHDTGTLARQLMEKDLVLDVALRLGKMVQQRLGAEVLYTRTDTLSFLLNSAPPLPITKRPTC